MDEDRHPDAVHEGGDFVILIVDDEPINLIVLRELLRPHYRVKVAGSGEAALQAAAQAPLPDLVLLDIMMPGMDGFEVLRRLRADPASADIPVVFVSALHDEESELQGLSLGAADYVHKPLRHPVVLSRVRTQLEAKAARDLLRQNNRLLRHQVEAGAHALEQAQMQLLQSEKLAAMGQLAAGIAHEINNPVSFVSSNLGTLEHCLQRVFALVDAYEAARIDPLQATTQIETLRQSLNYDFLRQDLFELLAESRDGIDRVSKIARDLKDFSRAGDAEWAWADLHKGLESTLNIVWNQLKYHCTVVRQYGVLPPVYCLPSQLNQVFMNLLINAAQAIEGRGTITLTTACEAEEAVRLTVADTGKGMSPEQIRHIFEPFFTTKPLGQGTGLGLSLAHGIVERHRGRIEVRSEPGKGSAFTVWLPVSPP